jgi:hypothetical protein
MTPMDQLGFALLGFIIVFAGFAYVLSIMEK